MAIFTPRGLKIRLPINFAFALMARLYPEVHPFKFLKTVEAFEVMPNAWAFVCLMAAYLVQWEVVMKPIGMGVVVVISHMTMHVYRLGFFPIRPPIYEPLAVFVALTFSYVSGWGIFLAVICAVTYLQLGWEGIAAYFVARGVAGTIDSALSYARTIFLKRKTSIGLTTSEINFFSTYHYLAKRYKRELDFSLDDSELEESNWRSVFDDLDLTHPEVVARFTDE